MHTLYTHIHTHIHALTHIHTRKQFLSHIYIYSLISLPQYVQNLCACRKTMRCTWHFYMINTQWYMKHNLHKMTALRTEESYILHIQLRHHLQGMNRHWYFAFSYNTVFRVWTGTGTSHSVTMLSSGYEQALSTPFFRMDKTDPLRFLWTLTGVQGQHVLPNTFYKGEVARVVEIGMLPGNAPTIKPYSWNSPTSMAL